jgi:hypothetical protein
MAIPAAPRPDAILIADQYVVETSRKLSPVGGLASFAVTDRVAGRADLMAIQLDRRLPPRPRAFQVLSSPIEGLLTPVVSGQVRDACYAVCLAPPGPSVQMRARLWPEAELLACVLRPAARVLAAMAARGITHRGIRLDNVFQSGPGQPVVLGSAWTAPPAIAQPALFEPPYSAMCFPAGRGDGTTADDVYALGVLLLCLALGHQPLEQDDDVAIIRRKLERGSYAALAGDERVPAAIGDLVRGMLAEDPEHRPPPALLLDPASARARRVAARPPRRAQRSMTLAGTEIWDARSLALALAVEPEQGEQAVRSGAVEQWLRRSLGDAQIATQVEELVRHRALDAVPGDGSAEAELLMRTVALVDPLAPLCWRGVAIWPDGIGPALAVAQADAPDVFVRLHEVIVREETAVWAALRADRTDAGLLRVEARQQHSWLQKRGGQSASGMARLAYLLNPLMPCKSPLLVGHWVARLVDLLPALEQVAGNAEHRQTDPIDTHIAAFIAARLERRMDQDLLAQIDNGGASLAQIRVLAQLQSRLYPNPLPALAVWLAARASPVMATWRNRDRRTAIEQRLQPLAAAGYLSPIIQLLDDPNARSADAQEAQQAVAALADLEAELARIEGGGGGRVATANRLGQEIAAGAGLAALAVALVIAAFG